MPPDIVRPRKGKIPVLILFGPTASGKTALLEELFIPKNIKGFMNPPYRAEIISADSMQVYQGMDIGTAKPPPEIRALIPHHLIDIKSPADQFNAGEFVRLAKKAIRSAAKNNALPVVSGGTGFYIKNLVQGLPASPPSDLFIRTDLKNELTEYGSSRLMEELAEKDPVSAAKIHPNDTYRLLRALEVLRQTGLPLSSFMPNESGTRRSGNSAFRFLILGLKREREELYRRINERCAQMFRDGLAEEVRHFFDIGYTPNDPGMRAIGYREFFVKTENPGKIYPEYTFSNDFEGVEAQIAGNSRRYAKRQMVFFASLPNAVWIEETDPAKAAEEIKEKLDQFLISSPPRQKSSL